MKIGDHVVLSAAGIAIGINKRFPNGRVGVIVSECRNKRQWNVLWTGNKDPVKITKHLVELATPATALEPALKKSSAPHARQRKARHNNDSKEYTDYMQELERDTGISMEDK